MTGQSLVLFIDDESLAAFGDREAALALARGAIARGIRIIALHDDLLEANLRIAAAATSLTPTIESGDAASVAPVVFVVADEKRPERQEEGEAEAELRHDDVFEWRRAGGEWRKELGTILRNANVRLVVGFGSHKRILEAQRIAKDVVSKEAKFYWSGAEQGRGISSLGTEMRIPESRVLAADLGLEEEDAGRISQELTEAVAKVLDVQKVLFELFGRITRVRDEFRRGDSDEERER